MFASDWDGYHQMLVKLKESLSLSKPVAVSFVALTLIDDPQLQYIAAKNYSKKFPGVKKIEAPVRSRNKKIRIGYFSGDFFNHATCILIRELFELHDKENFEIYGFSFGPNIHDQMTSRIKENFDHFHDVRNHTDEGIAALAIKCCIDIAVDLKGYTKDCRTGIFKYQLAPVVINYLGYPGTMANPNIHYIIADETIIPKEKQHFYSEKVAYLPHSYQINDSKRLIADYSYSREEVGLPQSGFVFCCFNNVYKLNPDVFDSWANILKKVDGSVLWLLEENEISTNNLIKEAVKRGISANRLIFAKRADNPHHLARSKLANLFLDTWPCNAHTTASDALWAGLPVITLIGQSFASRVCASLLNAVGLPELITQKIGDYEELAVELATNKDKYNLIKEKLIKNKLTTPLFNTENYVRDLEKIYIRMLEKIERGHPIDHIYLD